MFSNILLNYVYSCKGKTFSALSRILYLDVNAGIVMFVLVVLVAIGVYSSYGIISYFEKD